MQSEPRAVETNNSKHPPACPGRVARRVGHHPVQRKAAGSIPKQMSGLWTLPWSGILQAESKDPKC